MGICLLTAAAIGATAAVVATKGDIEATRDYASGKHGPLKRFTDNPPPKRKR